MSSWKIPYLGYGNKLYITFNEQETAQESRFQGESLFCSRVVTAVVS